MVSLCQCWACRAGTPNHCEGPNRAALAEKFRRDYEDAAASLVMTMALGTLPSDEAREQFKQRVRDASLRAKQLKATE